MPDGNSAESAGESLPKLAPSVHAPEADAPIAQAPREPLHRLIDSGTKESVELRMRR
jgi:hypothetical protein